MDRLTQLQQWYAAQCDGLWEQNFGLSINTLENPGWAVAIHLSGTALEGIEFTPIQQDLAENDWIECWIADGPVFQGAGDPSKLEAILGIFLDWAGQATASA
jgi:Immunity protein 53